MRCIDFSMMDIKINPKRNFFGYIKKKTIAGFKNEKYKIESCGRKPKAMNPNSSINKKGLNLNIF